MIKKKSRRAKEYNMTIRENDKLQENSYFLDRLYSNSISWVKSGLNLIHLTHRPSGQTITMDKTIKEPAYRNYILTKLLEKANGR